RGRPAPAAEGQRRGPPQGTGPRQPRAARQPESEMPARGMAHGHDVPEIEAMSGRDRPQLIRAARDVLERARPAPALVAAPPVFEAPGGASRTRERGAGRADVALAVFGGPAAA